MKELEDYIRSENVVFDHDPEPMVGLSYSGTEGIEILSVISILGLLLSIISSCDLISSI